MWTIAEESLLMVNIIVPDKRPNTADRTLQQERAEGDVWAAARRRGEEFHRRYPSTTWITFHYPPSAVKTGRRSGGARGKLLLGEPVAPESKPCAAPLPKDHGCFLFSRSPCLAPPTVCVFHISYITPSTTCTSPSEDNVCGQGLKSRTELITGRPALSLSSTLLFRGGGLQW